MKYESGIGHFVDFTVFSIRCSFFRRNDFIEQFNINKELQVLHIVVLTHEQLQSVKV